MPRFEAGAPIPARPRTTRASDTGLAEARRLLKDLSERREDAAPIRRAARDRPLALSAGGQRLWFLSQWASDQGLYNSPLALRLRGPLDPAALAQALTRIVGRHEVLRTRYPSEYGIPYQAVAPAPDRVELPLTDLADLPPSERETRALALANELAARPFDLAADSVLRAELIRLGAEDHLLVLCLHHIATDGWSTGIIIRELTAFYQAARGVPADRELPALPVQYADFAVWERDQSSVEATERLLTYWRGRLAGHPTLNFPADRSRPSEPSFRGAMAGRLLPERLRLRLNELARQQQASLLAVLLAAFNALVTRYTGDEDVVVGSVFSGRVRPEVENLIGFFANTLVLRTSTAGDPSFTELIDRTRDTVLGAHIHQQIGFDRLVQELQPERDLSRNPFFQIAFTLQNAVADGAGVEGLEVGHEPLDQDTARFDLSVQATEVPGKGLELGAEYATDLFDADRIERLLEQFGRVLDQVAADPGVRVSALDLLGPEGRDEALRQAVGPPLPGRADRLIHELFEERAAAQPELPACRFEGETATYGALNARANRLARLLRATLAEQNADPAGAETLVGLLLPRGPELPAAVLAVVKAGGAYLPLDPDHPADRIAWTVSDARCAVVLTLRHLAHLVPQGVHALLLDEPDTARALADLPGDNLGARLDPAHAAYVIYTSGSTGRPKGVVVEHRQVVSFVTALIDLFGLGPGDRVIQFANPAFDVSVSDFFSTFSSGATLVQAPTAVLHDTVRLGELMRDERVTFADIPPTILTELDPESLPDLRVAFIGLEPYPGELVNRWNKPGREFHNGYGPTEATVTCIDYHVPPGPLTTSPPIGKPMAGYRAHVLDPQGRPAPAGVPGELYLGGHGVTRGYLGRPALTAERFLPDPFGPPGSRLYRTGDVATRRPDGVLVFQGRIDRQIKLRGLRIEPGEIETALATHPDVRNGLLVVREGRRGPALVAYVVPEAGAEVSDTALRAHLSELLPLGLVPAAFVALDSLPLTASGKVDHDRLPAPDSAGADPAAHVMPRTATEQRLEAIWCAVLGETQISVRDDFFRLGGNSLKITQIIARANEAFGVSLSLRDFFRSPTVGGLAELVDTRRSEASAGAAEQGPAAEGGLTLLREGDGAPLFLLHPGNGASVPYTLLCQELPDGIPCYGVEADLDADAGSVDEMAQSCVDAILAACPHGPYRLAGWSVGAALAHAAAVQLRKRGAEVELLALFDAQEPPLLAEPPDPAQLRAAFAENVALTAGMPPAGPTADQLAGLTARQQDDEVIAGLIGSGLAPGESAELIRSRMGAFTALVAAAAVWRPEAYDGRIDLFTTGDTAEYVSGWSTWTTGSAVVHPTAGDHFSMMRPPHVAPLGRALGRLLAEAGAPEEAVYAVR